MFKFKGARTGQKEYQLFEAEPVLANKVANFYPKSVRLHRFKVEPDYEEPENTSYEYLNNVLEDVDTILKNRRNYKESPDVTIKWPQTSRKKTPTLTKPSSLNRTPKATSTLEGLFSKRPVNELDKWNYGNHSFNEPKGRKNPSSASQTRSKFLPIWNKPERYSDNDTALTHTNTRLPYLVKDNYITRDQSQTYLRSESADRRDNSLQPLRGILKNKTAKPPVNEKHVRYRGEDTTPSRDQGSMASLPLNTSMPYSANSASDATLPGKLSHSSIISAWSMPRCPLPARPDGHDLSQDVVFIEESSFSFARSDVDGTKPIYLEPIEIEPIIRNAVGLNMAKGMPQSLLDNKKSLLLTEEEIIEKKSSSFKESASYDESSSLSIHDTKIAKKLEGNHLDKTPLKNKLNDSLQDQTETTFPKLIEKKPVRYERQTKKPANGNEKTPGVLVLARESKHASANSVTVKDKEPDGSSFDDGDKSLADQSDSKNNEKDKSSEYTVKDSRVGAKASGHKKHLAPRESVNSKGTKRRSMKKPLENEENSKNILLRRDDAHLKNQQNANEEIISNSSIKKAKESAKSRKKDGSIKIEQVEEPTNPQIKKVSNIVERSTTQQSSKIPTALKEANSNPKSKNLSQDGKVKQENTSKLSLGIDYGLMTDSSILGESVIDQLSASDIKHTVPIDACLMSERHTSADLASDDDIDDGQDGSRDAIATNDHVDSRGDTSMNQLANRASDGDDDEASSEVAEGDKEDDGEGVGIDEGKITERDDSILNSQKEIQNSVSPKQHVSSKDNKLSIDKFHKEKLDNRAQIKDLVQEGTNKGLEEDYDEEKLKEEGYEKDYLDEISEGLLIKINDKVSKQGDNGHNTLEKNPNETTNPNEDQKQDASKYQPLAKKHSKLPLKSQSDKTSSIISKVEKIKVTNIATGQTATVINPSSNTSLNNLLANNSDIRVDDRSKGHKDYDGEQDEAVQDIVDKRTDEVTETKDKGQVVKAGNSDAARLDPAKQEKTDEVEAEEEEEEFYDGEEENFDDEEEEANDDFEGVDDIDWEKELGEKDSIKDDAKIDKSKDAKQAQNQVIKMANRNLLALEPLIIEKKFEKYYFKNSLKNQV